MGRYLERAEYLCRLLRFQVEALGDRPIREIYFGWSRIYMSLNRRPPGGSITMAGNDDFTLADSYTLADDLTLERSNSDSVWNCFSLGRENARQMRHCISGEMWTCLNLAYAHVMIAVARSWGVPARYVSGYLYVSGSPDGQAWSNATHAWIECLLPELGWVGFDPNNRSFADERHVRIATGRDYNDISPTRGVRQGGGETRLEVDVRMRPHADL